MSSCKYDDLKPHSNPLWGAWQIADFTKSTQSDFENPEAGYLFESLIEPNGSYFGGIRSSAKGAYTPITYRLKEDSIFFDNTFQPFDQGAKGVFLIKNDTLHLTFTCKSTQYLFSEKLIKQR